VREERNAAPSVQARRSMVYYLESSALLAALLEGDEGVRAALASGARIVTSALTFAECLRGLLRARASGRLSVAEEAALAGAVAALRSRCAIIPVSADVLDRVARPFPAEPVRTLDAVHLASLESLVLIRAALRVVTRDRRVRENAVQMGFAVE